MERQPSSEVVSRRFVNGHIHGRHGEGARDRGGKEIEGPHGQMVLKRFLFLIATFTLQIYLFLKIVL